MQNTAKLKLFAQQTRIKLRDFVQAKLTYVLTADTAELRGKTNQINKLRDEIKQKGEDGVIEEVAYTWFNRVMALRYMDANGYNTPMIVTPAEGRSRPEILQEALGGVVDDSLGLTPQEKLLPEEPLYRRLLVASCNQLSASMPFLFERISDYTELLLPDDLISANSFITDIRNGMTDEDCQQLQIVGWLYQFYITDRKKDAEDKKSRKGGLKSDEQAAATQLFTPDWIVRYMVENTVGRIWMTLHPESPLRKEMKYYIDPADGQPDSIPEHIHSVKDITFLDPCMGSGHILIYAFILFAKMYEEEGYRPKDIPQLIIENNLYGMDIDRRCYQLASFAITMTACRYFGKRYLRHAVAPRVIALQPIPHDVIDATGSWPKDSLIWQFEHIDTIGSLLKVTSDEHEQIHVHTGIFGGVEQLMKEEAAFLAKKYDCVVTNPPYLGKGFDDALKSYINKQFPNSKADLMATYMERCLDFCIINGKYAMINMQSWMFLSSFVRLRKNLIKTTQIDSMLHLGPHTFDELSGEVVQNTAFVVSNINDAENAECNGTYYRLVDGKNCADKERMFLENRDVNVDSAKVYYPVVKQKDFEKIPGCPISYNVTEKAIGLFNYTNLDKSNCLFRIGLMTGDNKRFLREWFEVSLNNSNFDCQSTEESIASDKKWYPINSGGCFRKWYGNHAIVANWLHDGMEMKKDAVIRNGGKHWSRYIVGVDKYYKEGISWNAISSSAICLRSFPKGFLIGHSSVCGYTFDDKYIMALLNTPISKSLLEVLSPTVNYGSTQVNKIPLIYKNQADIDKLVSNNITFSRLDWDAHETSWDFKENPLVEIMEAVANGKGHINVASEMGSQFNDADLLQQSCDVIKPLYDEYNVLVTSLQGLCHPSNGEPTDVSTLELCVKAFEKLWTARFMQLHANEEELNRQFINIYGLQDELTPDVPLNEITILQQGEITVNVDKIIWNDSVIVKQLVSYFVGCLMGRYSVDKTGLIIANQHQDLHALDLEVDGLEGSPKSTIAIDDDGIIPIIEEDSFFVDDMANRISKAVEAVFGKECFTENMRFIEHALGKTIREYLFKDFYADHVQMYSVKGDRRPIYWLFSSRMGDKHKYGYFRALVYMHRMEADTLSQLHATYVAPYLKKAETQLREAENELTRDDLTGAQRNKANRKADELRGKVREVKEFETKLVEMASHRTTFDLDDGVKANYPLFYPLVEPVKGLEKPKQKD